jgi:hypothetical protein
MMDLVLRPTDRMVCLRSSDTFVRSRSLRIAGRTNASGAARFLAALALTRQGDRSEKSLEDFVREKSSAGSQTKNIAALFKKFIRDHFRD